MSLYTFENGTFEKVAETDFSKENIYERRDLQDALKHKIEIVAPDCLVVSEEFSEWTESRKRIDLLAVDKDANIVVIELKRTETGSYMELQALRYASLVSPLTFRRTVEIFQQYLIKNEISKNAEEELLTFLGWDEPFEDDFNIDVRIILVSADFSKELTTSVLWLNEHNLDIRCIRLIPYRSDSKLLVDVQQLVPLPEAESYQVQIRQKVAEQREQRRSERDYTKYVFEEKEYNKRKLVLAVVSAWVKKNNPRSLEDLIEAFPQEIRRGGLFVPVAEAREIYNRQKIPRHFLEDDELVELPSGDVYAISNQWGSTNLVNFISQAIKLGYEISEK